MCMAPREIYFLSFAYQQNASSFLEMQHITSRKTALLIPIQFNFSVSVHWKKHVWLSKIQANALL